MMATVKETQPTVQMLLNSYDFLGALDLIATTQEVLQQELAGITSFRHLSHQLVEVEKMISRMLQEEYVRYLKAELFRPSTSSEDVLTDENKLISLVTGMIKLREYRFVDVLKEEVVVAIKGLLKDTIKESVDEEPKDKGDGDGGFSHVLKEEVVVAIKGLLKDTIKESVDEEPKDKGDGDGGFSHVLKEEVVVAIKGLLKDTIKESVDEEPKDKGDGDGGFSHVLKEEVVVAITGLLKDTIKESVDEEPKDKGDGDGGFSHVLKEEVVVAIKGLLKDTIKESVDEEPKDKGDGDGGFSHVLKEEVVVAITGLLKDTIKESVDEEPKDKGDGDGVSASLAEQMRLLDFAGWIELLQCIFKNLSTMCRRVKIFQDTFQELIDVVAQKPSQGESLKSPLIAPMEYDVAMPESDHTALAHEIQGIVFHACGFTHDRCQRVIVARAKDGFMERLSPEEFLSLSESVEYFVQECEVLCERKLPALRSCLQSQALKFVTKFHKEKKDKLGLILDSEYWKQAEVPERFQKMVDEISKTGKLRNQGKLTDSKPKQCLIVNGEKYALIGTALLFLEILVEYCQCAEALPSVAPDLVSRVVEILKTFNSRVCQLILGAGAVQLVGLRTISTKNLALASRCLQLFTHFIPIVQDHFDSLLPPKHQHFTKHFNKVKEDYENHTKEVFAKLLSIMEHHLSTALSKWEIEPPSPSPAFQLSCKHIRKLYENVCDILPNPQLQKLFLRIHDCFKRQLYLVLKANDITPHGSPSYSFVCSEFSYYMESIRSLPCCASVSETLSDIFLENL